jgi:hypothetical protein
MELPGRVSAERFFSVRAFVNSLVMELNESDDVLALDDSGLMVE